MRPSPRSPAPRCRWPQNASERAGRVRGPFLPSLFSPGDKIEKCSAKFLAVCWIVRVHFKAHRIRDGFSVSNALLLGQSARLSRKSLTHRQTMMAGRHWERSFLRFFGTWNLQFRNTQCDALSEPSRRIQGIQ